MTDETARSGWRPLSRGTSGAVPSPFSRLAITHAVSAAGDTFVTIALAGSLFFSISPTAARGKVALSLLFTIAPFAVVAPLLGPAIDSMKGGRKFMVFAASGGRAVTCLLMANVVDHPALFPAAFTTLVLSKAHAVAKSSLVPTTVGSEALLVEANSKLALLGVVGGFLASGPAILILRLADAAWVLRAAALVFCIGAVAALRITQLRSDMPAHRASPHPELHDPSIVLAATVMAALRFAVGFLTFLVAFSFRRTGAPSWWFGVVLAASMGGSMLAAVAAPRLRERVGEERILTGAIVALAAGGLVVSRWPGRPGTAVLAGILGLAAGAGKLAFDSLVQRDAPDAVQGRSFARFETYFQLVWVLGALVPVLVTLRDEGGYLLLFLLGTVITGTYLTGRRTVRHHAQQAT